MINIIIMKLLTISKWEFRKTQLNFSLRTRLLSVIILILIGAASFFVSQSGLHINDNIYRVIVTDPALLPILNTDDKFDVYVAKESDARYMFNQGNFDVLIIGTKIIHSDSQKSISALDALDKAIKKYDEARLLSYNDLNDTFPVWLNVKNIAREQAFQPVSIQKLPEFEKAREDTANAPTPAIENAVSENTQLPSIKEFTDIKTSSPLQEQTLATPSHFNPPIPFKSVVLSFIFIFPIYFIAQFFSSSIMEERVKRKGELLLVSPLSSSQIVLGKLLPYLLITLVTVAGMTFKLGGSPWIILILLPVSLMFLSTAFFGAIIARSFKELSFVLIFLSVFLSGYIFFPAMFANIHAISIISPITLVVKMLENEPVSISEYLFSTAPFYLVSTLVFMFGIFIYREEDLFTQKSIRGKLMDSLREFIARVPAPLFFLSIALLPLAFSIQLMLIVLMFNVPLRIGILVFIILAALIEEVVKSVGIYTVFSKKTAKVTTASALKSGILSGAGFFVGEKVLLLVVVASIAGSVFGSVMGIGLLVFPLLLHISSTTAASLSMRYLGTKNYLASLVLASVIHASYNLYLVRGVVFD
ncbi:MAG: ABC transporter permease [Candidatus Methanoperedens sp.]|nr:ABC transporter permease [Candidatus Methanoperedens sp.]MCZ7403751.1 ABC transporter permease [Candidatus Methanoperedens sp.]